jgi:hypothetical protein
MRNLSLDILDIDQRQPSKPIRIGNARTTFLERSIHHCAEIDELGCAKSLVAGIRNNITNFKGTNYLYVQWNQLPQDKRPVACDELTMWGIKVIRDVMIHIEHAVIAGYYNTTPAAQYYKNNQCAPVAEATDSRANCFHALR